MNKALRWGEAAHISPKAIEGILRGKRKLGVEFERVDQILAALDSPDHWYKELAQWYYPPGARHEREYETYVPQDVAFNMACAMFEGGSFAGFALG